MVDADVQRVGLSATVSDPAAVLGWLRGSSQRESSVVGSASPVQGEQLALTTYDGLADAVRVVGDAIGSTRALVFTRSRRRAEELAHALQLPVHHGSLSGQRRSDALAALAENRVPCASEL